MKGVGLMNTLANAVAWVPEFDATIAAYLVLEASEYFDTGAGVCGKALYAKKYQLNLLRDMTFWVKLTF